MDKYVPKSIRITRHEVRGERPESNKSTITADLWISAKTVALGAVGAQTHTLGLSRLTVANKYVGIESCTR